VNKAVIVVDLAYKSPQRRGQGTGRQGLSSTLKYLQYRDKTQNQLAANRAYERWQDRGMGVHWREILERCEALQSPHVLAWTWVISPAPDLMALVPQAERRELVCALTEHIVEEYYLVRGFDAPEYSYILHDRRTDDGGAQQLHTHVILGGTAPLAGCGRGAVYNNTERGHDALFREIASRHFSAALDQAVGPGWQRLREVEGRPLGSSAEWLERE
jgi:hypothetical protein